jgi:hypothetical protein
MKDLFGDAPYLPRQPHQLARVTDPGTSFVAGASVIPKLRETQRIVAQVLYENGNLTDAEMFPLCCALGGRRPESTYRKRRCELVDLGLVVDTGGRKKIGGSRRIVWALR